MSGYEVQDPTGQTLTEEDSFSDCVAWIKSYSERQGVDGPRFVGAFRIVAVLCSGEDVL